MSSSKLALVVAMLVGLSASPALAGNNNANGAGCNNGNQCASNNCFSDTGGSKICCSASCGSGQVCINGGNNGCCAATSICGTACCSSGQVCNGATSTCCTPLSCTGKCGSISDGCGNTLNCGGCSVGTCVSNVCTTACVPGTCASLGKTCGTTVANGCGGTLTCGVAGACATAGQVCTATNTCCTPTTCSAAGKNCGGISDGCGDAIDCGTCSSGQSCVNNVCTSCTAITCASVGKNCGTISDGCGGTLTCGTCTSPNSCGGSGVTNVCGSGQVTTAFSAGALIIPMDQCYNPDYAASANYTSNGTTCAAGSKFACYANYSTGNVRLPFGLMYLLAENNIPVSILLNPKKTGLGDADFTVTPPTGATTQTSSYLKWGSSSYAVSASSITSGTAAISYGGMPFVVDGPFADQAVKIITAWNNAHSGQFSSVPLHVINYDFTAPVLGVMGSRPKPVLIDGAPLTTFFDESGIPDVAPPGTTYLTISGTKPNFTYTWPSAYLGKHPGCSASDVCTTLTYPVSGSGQQRIIDVMWVHDAQYNQWTDAGTWYGAGGSALVVADATEWEASGVGGVGGGLKPAANGAQKGPYCATVGVSGANLNATPGPSTDYPASNKYLQIGDMNLFVHGVGGGDGSAYEFGSTPYPHTHALTNMDNYTVITGHPKVNGTQTPGSVIYLGSLNSWHGGSAGKDAGLHVMYNTLLTGGDGGTPSPPQAYVGTELSRSPAIGGPNGVYYVGTFDWNVPANPGLPGNNLYVPPVSVYPYMTGHFREYKAATDTSAAVGSLLSLACDETDPASICNWDINDNIPTWSTRNAFLGTVSGTTYGMSLARTLTSDPTMTYVGNNIQQFMGGVDYAAGAYLQSKSNSPVSGASTRPAVVYVGARDGMLHAFCADLGGCYGQGRGNELWAFIPPAVKSKMDTALANSDWSQVNVGGVLHAVDAQDTFGGTTAWRTVLVGGTREGGSVFALDVSDPNPANYNTAGKLKFLWETNADPSTASIKSGVTSYRIGQTKGAVFASNGSSKVVAVVTSSVYNSSTTSNSGINTYLISLADGKILAANQKLYTKRVPLVGGSSAQIANDVPATPTLVDTDGDGTDETLLVPDFEGVVRKFTLDLTNQTLGTPTTLIDTSSKCSSTSIACQPIGASVSVGRYGTSNALAAYMVTGGADWARSTTTHSYTVGVNISTGAVILDYRDMGTVTPPVSTVGGGTSMAMPIRGYAPVSVAGTDLYAQGTTISLGNFNSLVQPVLFPGTYGQVNRWGNLNTGTIDTTAYTLITAGQNFSGGAGAVLEFDNLGSNGQLALLGSSTTERIVLAANSTSLRQTAYAVQTVQSGSRPFSVMTWFDLGN